MFQGVFGVHVCQKPVLRRAALGSVGTMLRLRRGRVDFDISVRCSYEVVCH